MTTLTNQNYLDLIKILRLSPGHYAVGSNLRAHGKRLEDFDTQEGSTFVEELQDEIACYLAKDEEYLLARSQAENTGYKSGSVSGEFSVTYTGDREDEFTQYLVPLRSHRANIVRLLEWDESTPYNSSTVRSIS